jgi:hypothetical protein
MVMLRSSETSSTSPMGESSSPTAASLSEDLLRLIEGNRAT